MRGENARGENTRGEVKRRGGERGGELRRGEEKRGDKWRGDTLRRMVTTNNARVMNPHKTRLRALQENMNETVAQDKVTWKNCHFPRK